MGDKYLKNKAANEAWRKLLIEDILLLQIDDNYTKEELEGLTTKQLEDTLLRVK